ncbi:hypothetical protein ABTM24_19760, partial [Acinetobacter baumannii]
MVDVHTKMKTRNIPLIEKFLEKYKTVPKLMALGYAAYIVATSSPVSFPWDNVIDDAKLFEEKVVGYVNAIKQNGVVISLEKLV